MAAEGAEQDASESLARELLGVLRRDPAHLPERLAVFAVGRLGPRADAAAAQRRTELPDASEEQLAQVTAAHGVRTTIAVGAFVGGPFLVLIPVAFCAALLAQLQLVLELAALAGRKADAPERVAELLVLQGAHPDVPTAQAALRALTPEAGAGAAAAAGADAASHGRGGGRLRTTWSLGWRMAALLGLTSPTDPDAPRPRLIRVLAQWALLGVVFLVGLVVPLVWLPYMAVSYRRSTNALAERADRSYRESSRGPLRREHGRAAPAFLAAAARALFSVALTLVLVGLVLRFDLNLAGRRWPVAALVAIGGGTAAGGWWLLRRRHRAHRDS